MVTENPIARFRVNDPQLFDSSARILLFLVYKIQATGFWRKILYHKLQRTLRSFLGQNSEPLIQNNNYVRLKHVDLIQINIKWSVKEFPDWIAFQVAVQFKLQVTRNFLMKPVRRRSHIKVTLDQLIPRPGLRQELVIRNRVSGGKLEFTGLALLIFAGESLAALWRCKQRPLRLGSTATRIHRSGSLVRFHLSPFSALSAFSNFPLPPPIWFVGLSVSDVKQGGAR